MSAFAGGSKRNLQQSAAESPAAEPRSTKRLKSLERVLSVGTVLQCVDKRCDRDGPFDAAVGQRPATVHEVTEGDSSAAMAVELLHKLHKLGITKTSCLCLWCSWCCN